MSGSAKRAAWASVGVALLVILIYESGPTRIASDLQSVGGGLIVIIALEFVVDGFHTLGWWFTFPPDARRGTYWTLYFVRLAGTALNQTIPAASMGGEPAKVFLLEPHFPVATAIATVMTSSLIFSLSKAIFIAFGMIVTWHRVQLPHGFVVAVVIGFLATLAGILTFLFFNCGDSPPRRRASLPDCQSPRDGSRALSALRPTSTTRSAHSIAHARATSRWLPSRTCSLSSAA